MLKEISMDDFDTLLEEEGIIFFYYESSDPEKPSAEPSLEMLARIKYKDFFKCNLEGEVGAKIGSILFNRREKVDDEGKIKVRFDFAVPALVYIKKGELLSFKVGNIDLAKVDKWERELHE